MASTRVLMRPLLSDRHPHDDQNRVVLLAAAVHGRHGRPRLLRSGHAIYGSARFSLDGQDLLVIIGTALSKQSTRFESHQCTLVANGTLNAVDLKVSVSVFTAELPFSLRRVSMLRSSAVCLITRVASPMGTAW